MKKIRDLSLLMPLLLFGCVSTQQPATEYFLLNSTAKSADAFELPPFRLGIGPVELAAYLNQEGIANHLAGNQVEYADNRRWAEPLSSNISQVLLSNLSTLLPGQVVYPFPWKVSQNPDYQIIININRFGWFPPNRVALNARVVIENDSKDIVYSGEQDIELTATDSGYESNVSTQNKLLEQFSLRLANILRNSQSKP